MTGPESLRLRALIDKHVADGQAADDLKRLVSRCASAESARDMLRGALHNLSTEACTTIRDAEAMHPNQAIYDPR